MTLPSRRVAVFYLDGTLVRGDAFARFTRQLLEALYLRRLADSLRTQWPVHVYQARIADSIRLEES